MDDSYNVAYEQLYKRLAAQVNFYPEARTTGTDAERLKTIIEDSEQSQHAKLRSDARYLLSVLLLQMIVMPVAIVRPSTMDEVWASIEEDVKVLVSRARRRTSNDNITGHAMLDTISESWSRLRTTNFRLWGD